MLICGIGPRPRLQRPAQTRGTLSSTRRRSYQGVAGEGARAHMCVRSSAGPRPRHGAWEEVHGGSVCHSHTRHSHTRRSQPTTSRSVDAAAISMTHRHDRVRAEAHPHMHTIAHSCAHSSACSPTPSPSRPDPCTALTPLPSLLAPRITLVDKKVVSSTRCRRKLFEPCTQPLRISFTRWKRKEST